MLAAGFPAAALTIEITEGAFVQEPDRVRQTLETLRGARRPGRDRRLRTGYSSLSYLKDLPVDVLKIDRSFVSDLSDRRRARRSSRPRSSSHTASGSTVVAEGVETEEQYECLEELGCDLIQGYVVSKPVSAANLGPLLEDAYGRRAVA